MKFAVIRFPGSNSDHDSHSVIKYGLAESVEYVWHQETDLSGFDCVILPGGFSYGDYLRAGAIARFSPIMSEIQRFVKSGGLVFGVCNGFQALVEANILPGALMRNRGLRFLGRWTYLKVENNQTPFTTRYQPGEIIRVPVAHGEGNFFADSTTLATLEDQKRVVFRYCDENGEVTEKSNINGSLNSIAGIINEQGNALGMMPHPERAADSILGSKDGLKLFQSVNDYLKEKPKKELAA